MNRKPNYGISKATTSFKTIAYVGLVSLMIGCESQNNKDKHSRDYNPQADKNSIIVQDGTLFHTDKKTHHLQNNTRQSQAYGIDTTKLNNHFEKISQLESSVENARHLADSAFNRFMKNYTQESFHIFSFPKTYLLLSKSQSMYSYVRKENKKISKYVNSLDEKMLSQEEKKKMGALKEKTKKLKDIQMSRKHQALKEGYHQILYSWCFDAEHFEKKLSETGVQANLKENENFLNAAKRDKYLFHGSLLTTLLATSFLLYKDCKYGAEELHNQQMRHLLRVDRPI